MSHSIHINKTIIDWHKMVGIVDDKCAGNIFNVCVLQDITINTNNTC
jgi:hypothetical protein